MDDDLQSESTEGDDYDLVDEFTAGLVLMTQSPMETGEPISDSDINFDRSLPSRHTYLGRESLAVDISNFQEPRSIVSLQVVYRPGIVLIPGYTLPLMVTNYTEEEIVFIYRNPVAILPGCLGRSASPTKFKGHVATIAYLMSVKFSDSGCSPVLLGRQRLRIMEVKVFSANSMCCKGLVLPEASGNEISLGPISALSIPPSLRRFAPEPDFSPLPSSNDEQSSSSETRVFPYPLPGDSLAVLDASCSSTCPPAHPQDFRHLPYRRDVLAAAANCTANPAWVYRQYDIPFLMAEIRAELSLWTNTWRLDKWDPSLAVPFSYWLLQNLPLTCVQKGELLKLDHVVQRLRACLQFIHSCSALACSQCKSVISSQKDLICLSHEGSTQAYVNPHGLVFDILTLSAVRQNSVNLMSSPTAEYSWYPGYAWAIANCNSCYGQLGWQFTATEDHLRPRLFWGINRGALVRIIEEDIEVDA